MKTREVSCIGEVVNRFYLNAKGKTIFFSAENYPATRKDNPIFLVNDAAMLYAWVRTPQIAHRCLHELGNIRVTPTTWRAVMNRVELCLMRGKLLAHGLSFANSIWTCVSKCGEEHRVKDELEFPSGIDALNLRKIEIRSVSCFVWRNHKLTKTI
jgi:hypothetical protein